MQFFSMTIFEDIFHKVGSNTFKVWWDL